MIEREIPKEIRDYKEKTIFGLNLRQLIATIATLAICIPTYIFGKPVFGENTTSWICILIGMPVLMFGFYRKNEMPFERYFFAYLYTSFLSNSKRCFKSKNFFEELLEQHEK